jgi:glycosyltransferase involved in cell wall biosynthesis
MNINKFDKAYILYANETYFDIVSMCAKSIREFSNTPIIVYMLNSDKQVNISNTKSIRWNCNIDEFSDNGMYNEHTSKENFYINRSHDKIYNLLIQRPLVVKDALLNYADTVVYVDCDSIATPYVDKLFYLYDRNSPHPYITEGIYNHLMIDGRGGVEHKDTLEYNACELFGTNQDNRNIYRTTNVFVAGQNTIDFLEEWYWMCTHPKILKNFKHYAPFHEETIVNVLLWKNNYQKGLPYVYVNGDAKKVDIVFNEVIFNNNHQTLGDWFKVPGKKEDICFFHGEKRLEVMQEMIDKIKQYNPIKENKKILCIAPHLSTGGMPQYLLKKIQSIKDQYNIYLVEYACVSGEYVVQREQLKWILEDKFYTLEENKLKLLDIIDQIQPDVIHLEDTPESFMDSEVSSLIFGNTNRDYFIIESTHSSLTVPSNLLFHPDKFILPSKWIQQKFTEQLSQIPNDIWEYPIENYHRDQRKAQEFLKLNPNQKHVLMVGLFTPGKNQGEIFEIAKQLPEVQFHFVGNQAPNFAEYWEPLMKNKPDNCIVWGERDDVSNFYQACDVFYFSSKFELMPLSIKEALSYGLPCLFRRLETYMDSYDNNSLVHYIDDNLDKTKEILCTLI